MSPTTKAEWIAALRSGNYIQGQHRLARVGDDNKVSHCCLGVLCELAGAPLMLDQFTCEIDGYYLPSHGLQLRTIPLEDSHNVISDLSLNTMIDEDGYGSGDDGQPDYQTLMDKLMNMNDNGKSFDEIADYLESLP